MTPLVRERFLASLGFEADPFQLAAFDALDEGHSVLVAAPTGSGKTVVAEYAIAKAVDSGHKAFYTTPLKALSNQKYGDLARSYGPERVGLLTGDNAINGHASVVVMTTEVLRNMIYAGAEALKGLRYVVLDEVHYLQNLYRGAVWEEVIVHAPPEVDLVCLSATVSNAEEFADWVQTVRGSTRAVIEERRPVELTNLYLVGDRAAEQPHLLPTFVDGRPNPEANALDSRNLRRWDHRGRSHGGRLYTPRRAEVVEILGERSMLPVIYFIFSRAACDDAVGQCLQRRLRLTTPEERRRIRAIAESKVEPLSDGDLAVLGYGTWLSGLEAGFAAHHAGLVPPFKEAVEACFSAALVKVVFATETLSLGINMPARSVAIEKLSKYNGERHEALTPGEYTQLTGRAGRRGIDEQGFAVVLWSPFVPFEQVAGLASTRAYALSSSFRPTYNMAANLVRRYAPDSARHLLNLSFAQYRTDADVVRLETQLERASRALVEATEQASCKRGDVEEYRLLVRDAGRRRVDADVALALGLLKPGDVLQAPGGRGAGRLFAVLATSQRRGGDVRVIGLTADRRRLSLSPRDFADPPAVVARVPMPAPYAPRTTAFQRAVSEALARTRVEAPAAASPSAGPASPAEAHPVASCPDAPAHLRALERARRAGRDVDRLEHRIRGRAESLARQFDRVLRLLQVWGYVEGWTLTEGGERLVRLYHECDLLVAECVGAGLLDGLDAPSLAGLVSVFTYELRKPGAVPAPRFPSAEMRRRWLAVEEIAQRLNEAEDEAALPATRPPDPGFLAAAHAWAAGESLEEVLAGEEMSGGDFVRNVKQLVDLLRQVAEVVTDPGTAKMARAGADHLFRGVVAASSVLGVEPVASPTPRAWG
ncbi:MAG TPA: DEAD/DEAH box helicase [Acidimicrobiales bacterium]|nr:DEAD/DEAH box helicase [Acidimicrobiales bacterium]